MQSIVDIASAQLALNVHIWVYNELFINYRGEIVVPTENLSSLFKAGRVLQISGLTSVDTVGVRAPNTPLFDNVQSMHKDTSGATLSMETNQASETRLDTSRNEDANKLQSSNGSRKSRGSSAALENVSQSEKHTHKCKGANSAIVTVEAAEPSDKSNQKRPETVDLSETESFEKTPTQQQQQAKGNCTVISDDDSSRCMFMTDEESQSSDFDYKYFEEQEEVSYLVSYSVIWYNLLNVYPYIYIYTCLNVYIYTNMYIDSCYFVNQFICL